LKINYTFIIKQYPFAEWIAKIFAKNPSKLISRDQVVGLQKKYFQQIHFLWIQFVLTLLRAVGA
jgi:hypothetical protein